MVVDGAYSRGTVSRVCLSLLVGGGGDGHLIWTLDGGHALFDLVVRWSREEGSESDIVTHF